MDGTAGRRPLPGAITAEWVENPASREDWLYYVGRDGLAFLSNVPVEDAAVLQVAALIGFIRETNDGGSSMYPAMSDCACRSTPAILIVILCPVSSCCIVFPLPAQGGESIFRGWNGGC